MDEGGRKRKGRGRAGAQQRVTDIPRESFVRAKALDKWRELLDLCDTLGFDWPRAAREAGTFPERGQYRSLWSRRWEEHVLGLPAGAPAGARFAAIEMAVAAAVADEAAARAERGDRPLDEEPEYRALMDAMMARLLGEASAWTEPC
jgi:hypothetical protein